MQEGPTLLMTQAERDRLVTFAMSSGRLILDRVGRHQSPSPLNRHTHINMHLSELEAKGDISTLPAWGHFYFALTRAAFLVAPKSDFLYTTQLGSVIHMRAVRLAFFSAALAVFSPVLPAQSTFSPAAQTAGERQCLLLPGGNYSPR